MRRRIVLAISILVLASTGLAQDRRMAVVDFVVEGAAIDGLTGSSIRDRLVAKLDTYKRCELLDRSNVEALLREQDLNSLMLSSYPASALKFVGADYLVVGAARKNAAGRIELSAGVVAVGSKIDSWVTIPPVADGDVDKAFERLAIELLRSPAEALATAANKNASAASFDVAIEQIARAGVLSPQFQSELSEITKKQVVVRKNSELFHRSIRGRKCADAARALSEIRAVAPLHSELETWGNTVRDMYVEIIGEYDGVMTSAANRNKTYKYILKISVVNGTSFSGILQTPETNSVTEVQGSVIEDTPDAVLQTRLRRVGGDVDRAGQIRVQWLHTKAIQGKPAIPHPWFGVISERRLRGTAFDANKLHIEKFYVDVQRIR